VHRKLVFSTLAHDTLGIIPLAAGVVTIPLTSAKISVRELIDYTIYINIYFFTQRVHIMFLLWRPMYECCKKIEMVICLSLLLRASLLSECHTVFCYLIFRWPCPVIYPYYRSQQDALFLNFILVKNSTCFEQIYCPSSGVLILYLHQLIFVILVMLTVY